MPYIIAQPCIDVKDRGCVDVCPVDCIYEGPDQLYIHPDECIDCGACEPECPWQAIFEEDSVPQGLREDVALNYAMESARENFVVAEHMNMPPPGAEQISANKEKWGLGA